MLCPSNRLSMVVQTKEKNAKTVKPVEAEAEPVEKEESEAGSDLAVLEEIKEHAKCIEKFVLNKEPRFMLRVIRTLVSTRKKLNSRVLRKLINGFYTASGAQKDTLLAFIEQEPMEVDSSTQIAFKGRTGKAAQSPLLIELDVYFHLLLLLHLIDSNSLDSVRNPVCN